MDSFVELEQNDKTFSSKRAPDIIAAAAAALITQAHACYQKPAC